MRKLITIILGLAVCCANLAMAADKKFLNPAGTKPGASFTQGVLVDGTMYVSGQGGEDATGKIPVTFEAEMKQCFSNISDILKTAGMTLRDVVAVQVYLSDGKLFPAMNTVYREFFNEPRPTRTTVVVAKLVGEGHVEITVTAKK
jgi:2-iminobutanoate/2-iminopropanoate deaminase